jgi:hypothetical protein
MIRSFLQADIKLFFLAGRRLGSVSRGQLSRSVFLAGSCLGSVSRRQLLLQAVKVWPLHGFQILLSSTCNYVRR